MDMPNDYKNAGIIMLVAGIINLMLGGVWILGSMCMCLNSWVTLVVAIAEIGVGIMILTGNKVPAAKFVSIGGIVGGLLSLSMMAVGLEVFAFILLGKPEVEEYLNG